MIEDCLVAELTIEGDDCPLAAATRAVDVTVDCAPPLLRADGYTLLRFSAPESDRLADTLDADDRIRYLHRSRAKRDTYRCLSLSPCVVHELVDAGFMIEGLTYREGTALVTGTVVGQAVLRSVLERAGETVGTGLERLYALEPGDERPVARRWDITPAQEAALEAAVAMGYFTVPREVTASEVAAALDISKSAFLERLRRGQHTLFSQLLGTDGSEHTGRTDDS
jgi:predicted DNA binding protein